MFRWLAELFVIACYGTWGAQQLSIKHQAGSLHCVVCVQDIGDRYPQWLAKHADSLSDEDLNRYTRQHQHILEMCRLYDEDPDNFSAIYDCLQQVDRACSKWHLGSSVWMLSSCSDFFGAYRTHRNTHLAGISDLKVNPAEYLLFHLLQMQACGTPPEEIVQELSPGLQFDADGLPQLPTGAPPGCCIQ